MVYGETLRRGEGNGGGEDNQFFRDQSERMLQLAIEPVRLATGKVSPVDVQQFINGAAMTPDQLSMPEWQAGFHNQILKRAYEASKTPIEQADFEQVIQLLARRAAQPQRPHAIQHHHARDGHPACIVQWHCPGVAFDDDKRHAGGDGSRANGC